MKVGSDERHMKFYREDETGKYMAWRVWPEIASRRKSGKTETFTCGETA